MGRTVEREAQASGIEVSAIFDTTDESAQPISVGALKGIDCVIDFTLPEAVSANVALYCEAGVPMVIGTTGWEEYRDGVRELVESNSAKLLWSSNFSLGVNAYYRVIAHVAHLMSRLDDYDVWVRELHHRNKLDSPSGTAMEIARIISREHRRKERAVFDKLDRRLAEEEFHVASVRGGDVNFEHDVVFDAPFDSIRLSHSARNRDGYARGALTAAHWLCEQDPGFYSSDDFMNAVLGDS